MNRRFRPPLKSRNSRGAVASLIMVALLLVIIAAASLSFDYAHGLLIREELQSAADAGALAGAYELARTTVTPIDKQHAEQYAQAITADNMADQTAVSNSTDGTTVSISVNGDTMPRTVTVTATRITANFFARLIGCNTMPVSATATAQAYKGIKQVKPNQLLNLAVSLDTIPSKGPQQGVALNDLMGPNAYTQKFTIVLNPQGAKNAAWLKNWSPHQNPVLTMGVDSLIMNGVDANAVADLKVGDTIYVPLITGDPPYNKSRTIVGVAGFKITQINFPQQIEGYLKNPLIVKGTPGVPVMNALGLDNTAFLDQNSPWQLQLIN